MRKLFVIRQAILALCILCLAACASTGNPVSLYGVQFNAIKDSPDIDVLDYAYGQNDKPFFGPSKVIRDQGKWTNNDNMTGYLPRGEFLYVKWRIKQSGEILEDRVDLRTRLPMDLTNTRVRFVIHERHLYVFVEWDLVGQRTGYQPAQDAYKPIPGGVKLFNGRRIQQIYPDPLPQ